uniref:PX domain-containing protein n=1 Tax=Periophthalmus magnuspinnatus TaxID=409849 RepID=A0A3B4AWW1_9GOBI
MISQREKGELARFYTVTDPKKHKKGYTVYKVTARVSIDKYDSDKITVWKRYNDFRKLHQNLWQLHKNVCSQSELFPPFAKAKVFGRFDDSVIEERRQCSEDLLQFSANIPALYNSQHIQEFFKSQVIILKSRWCLASLAAPPPGPPYIPLRSCEALMCRRVS